MTADTAGEPGIYQALRLLGPGGQDSSVHGPRRPLGLQEVPWACRLPRPLPEALLARLGARMSSGEGSVRQGSTEGRGPWKLEASPPRHRLSRFLDVWLSPDSQQPEP